MPRDFTVLFVWDVLTAGLPGTGSNTHGIHRDKKYWIEPRRDSTGWFTRDIPTVVLPGTGTLRDHTRRKTTVESLKIFLSLPEISRFYTTFTVLP